MAINFHSERLTYQFFKNLKVIKIGFILNLSIYFVPIEKPRQY